MIQVYLSLTIVIVCLWLNSKMHTALMIWDPFRTERESTICTTTTIPRETRGLWSRKLEKKNSIRKYRKEVLFLERRWRLCGDGAHLMTSSQKKKKKREKPCTASWACMSQWTALAGGAAHAVIRDWLKQIPWPTPPHALPPLKFGASWAADWNYRLQLNPHAAKSHIN